MPEQIIQRLADGLVAAHRAPSSRVPASALTDLDAASAMAVQAEVLRQLGESASVAKVMAPVGGTALASPIFDSWVTTSGGTLALSGRDLMGVEIEIAAVLKADITPEIASQGKSAVQNAIDHYIVGIELIGTRIDQHTLSGPFGPLSDFLLSAGYVLGGQRIAFLPDVNGMSILLETEAGVARIGSAKHPFGGVLDPILAYACAPFDQFGGLRAGMTVTTGSLCALVEVPAKGWVQLRLGDFDPISVTLL